MIHPLTLLNDALLQSSVEHLNKNMKFSHYSFTLSVIRPADVEPLAPVVLDTAAGRLGLVRVRPALSDHPGL